MPAYTTVVTHATGDVLPATDWNTDLRDNIAFLHDRGADLASAANLVGGTNQAHRVTGTTTITAIPAPAGTGQGGNRLLLKFQSAGCAITAGAAIILTNGPFVSVANGVIEFWWDDAAAAWIEIGRLNGLPGLQVATATKTANVTTTGTTYAAGVDVLASALSFGADGVSTYVVDVYCPAIGNGSSACSLALNLDGAQRGIWTGLINNAGVVPRFYLSGLAAGAHTVNPHMWTAGGTCTLTAGDGTGTNPSPAIVVVTRL